jgi:hypothetical protein
MGAWWWLDEPLQLGALAGLLLVTVGILRGCKPIQAIIPSDELKMIATNIYNKSDGCQF